MSTYERYARDWVERREREYREDHRNPDDLYDDRKDRALTDSDVSAADEHWSIK